MRRICTLFFILIALSLPVISQPKHEVRAVWLTTIGGLDWPHNYANTPAAAKRQQQELRNILDRLQQANINTVLLQTRVRATTIYPSDMEPWDGCLSGVPGKSPGYDALQFAIDECHARGMELHAWVVTIPVGKWNKTGCQQLRKKYPQLIRKIGEDGYMNPENPETAHYLARMCQEITRRYDIDGIHLDYIRYPETWKISVPKSRGREYITQIVREIHRSVKPIKPWVKLSCSPIGKADDVSRYSSRGWNAYTTVCQDATGWLRQGLMDALFPMMYFKDNNFYPFAIDWQEQSCGRPVVPGLGIYFMSPREKNWKLGDITREMYVSRQLGMGHAFFRSQFFTDDVKGIYRFTKNDFNRYPALVPPMTWESATRPASPASLTLDEGMLSWQAPASSQELTYNIYASRRYPVDTEDARNLVAARHSTTAIAVKPTDDAPLHYAVCAMDRYGNESLPAQMDGPSAPSHRAEWQRVSGNTMRLPRKPETLDADLIALESLSGTIVATFPYQGRQADVSGVADGVYQLRSINSRGVTHRLGYVMIKRQ